MLYLAKMMKNPKPHFIEHKFTISLKVSKKFIVPKEDVKMCLANLLNYLQERNPDMFLEYKLSDYRTPMVNNSGATSEK